MAVRPRALGASLAAAVRRLAAAEDAAAAKEAPRASPASARADALRTVRGCLGVRQLAARAGQLTDHLVVQRAQPVALAEARVELGARRHGLRHHQPRPLRLACCQLLGEAPHQRIGVVALALGLPALVPRLRRQAHHLAQRLPARDERGALDDSRQHALHP
ncbi:MAG: hypothetical protein WKG00_11830 [Polyangiaceae bacterium]